MDSADTLNSPSLHVSTLNKPVLFEGTHFETDSTTNQKDVSEAPVHGSVGIVLQDNSLNQSDTIGIPSNERSTFLADREVELLSAATTSSPVQLYELPNDYPSTVERNARFQESRRQILELIHNTSGSQSSQKSFDHEGLKRDLDDIETRLKVTRGGEGGRRFFSMEQIQAGYAAEWGLSPDRGLSPEFTAPSLNSSLRAVSINELEKRLKWDYGADIGVSAEERAAALKIKLSQGSFVASPDPEDNFMSQQHSALATALAEGYTPNSVGLLGRVFDILRGQAPPHCQASAIIAEAERAEAQLHDRQRPRCSSLELERYDLAVSQDQSRLSFSAEDLQLPMARLLDAVGFSQKKVENPGYVETLPPKEKESWKRLQFDVPYESSHSDGTEPGGRSTERSARSGLSARSQTTMESSHDGSDDAHAPIFPSDAYGSRPEPVMTLKHNSNNNSRATSTRLIGGSSGKPPKQRLSSRDLTARSGIVLRANISSGGRDEHLTRQSSSSKTLASLAAQKEDKLMAQVQDMWERYEALVARKSTSGERLPRETLVQFVELMRQPVKTLAAQEAALEVLRSPNKDGKLVAFDQSSKMNQRARSTQTNSGTAGSAVPASETQAGNHVADEITCSEEEERTDWDVEVTEITPRSNTTTNSDTDTLHLMTRMTAYLRAKEVEQAQVKDDTISDSYTLDVDSSQSDLDPQILYLKRLILRQKEKYVLEQQRKARRKKNIRALQNLIEDRLDGRQVAIPTDLDTDSASILSEATTADADPALLDDVSITKSASHSQQPTNHVSRRRSSREHASRAAAKPQYRNRSAQVYPPAETWCIEPPSKSPGRFKESHRISQPHLGKENCKPFGGPLRTKYQPPNVKQLKSEQRLRTRSQPHARIQRRSIESKFLTGQRAAGAVSGGGVAWYMDTRDCWKPLHQRSRVERRKAAAAAAGLPVDCEDDSASQELHSDVDVLLPVNRVPGVPSLSEALAQRRPDFLSRAGERQKRVRLAAEERRYVSALESDRRRLFGHTTDKRVNRVRPREYHPLAEALHRPAPRLIDRRSMREHSRQRYVTLPEVQQHFLEERQRAQQRTNRLRAQLYGEKVLRAVLKKRGAWQVVF